MKRSAVDILRDLVALLPQAVACVEKEDKNLGIQLDVLLKESREAIKPSTIPVPPPAQG
jgi:hypothetical protein